MKDWLEGMAESSGFGEDGRLAEGSNSLGMLGLFVIFTQKEAFDEEPKG